MEDRMTALYMHSFTERLISSLCQTGDLKRPKARMAFEIREVISSSISTCWKTVLLRQANLSTADRSWLLTPKAGFWYGIQGWCITTFLSADGESEVVTGGGEQVQSSLHIHRTGSIQSTVVRKQQFIHMLERTLRHCLKPSHFKQFTISVVLEFNTRVLVLVSIPQHSGEHETKEGWGKNTASVLSWNFPTIWINLFGQSFFHIIFHRPSLFTMSKAFVRSIHAVCRICSWHFSCYWRTAKIMSMVLRSLWRPHCVSGRRPDSRW